jgi:phosphoglycolate phosphatase-like HAD superfamily hydrolase
LDEVFVIGDTPKDIACARAMGARCIAVATGSYDRASLEHADAWAVLDSLEPDALVSLLKS